MKGKEKLMEKDKKRYGLKNLRTCSISNRLLVLALTFAMVFEYTAYSLTGVAYAANISSEEVKTESTVENDASVSDEEQAEQGASEDVTDIPEENTEEAEFNRQEEESSNEYEEEGVPETDAEDGSVFSEPEEETSDEYEEEAVPEEDASYYPVFAPEPVETDGVWISVSAPEGVFPEGAVLSVKKISAAEQESADAAVDEQRDGKRNIAASYTYDIKVLASDGVTELEPADRAKVRISFSLAEAADQNLDADIYHVKEDEKSGELYAEKLDVIPDEKVADDPVLNDPETTVAVETDSFSYYTVEFTYEKMEYVLEGDSSVPMSDILSAVGLKGEVTAAEVSDDTLFKASDESGEWMVSALKAFDTVEWMKVTINDVVYEITVTDDSGELVRNVSYRELSWNGKEIETADKTHDAYAVPSNGAMTSGWYYLNSDVTVDGRAYITGDTCLILGDGKKLDVEGFYVPKGYTLTVYAQSAGTGRIYSRPSGGAGIGAYSGHKGGNIVIHGGYIDSKGHDHCAGIGSNDEDRKDVGSITIYSGNITAAADGDSGAGIGGGRASEGGNITIYGGTVNATGAHYGAGIGGGNGQGTDPLRGGHGGTITIWGGEITARGGDDGAGIGGGEGGNAGTITINGGTVTATGGNNSAGLGTGEGESTGVGGTVTINGGNVTARGGGDAAGIGGGEDAHCDTVTINGGTVNATGGSNGAGIGAGRNADGGNIIITGGEVTAEGRDSSAGIGGGDASGSYADYSNIEISGGTIRATGNSKGAGIGGGEYGHATVHITGGNITATGGSSGGAGIGNGKDGSGSAIILDYNDETASSISITINRGSYKGTVSLLKPFKNSAADPEKFRETGSVSDLDKLAADPPLVAWTDAEAIEIGVEVNSWKDLQEAIDLESTNERNIKLTGDISAGIGDTRIVIPEGKNITIDLNGHEMDRRLSAAQAKDDGSVIYVENNATLTIADSSSEKTGIITGGHSAKGGGILNEGTVHLKGGSVTENKASKRDDANGAGGGIYNAGTLTVSGGNISGNTAETWGGGIYLADGTGSVLNLNGGEITGNTCGNNGGGVHVSGSAYINVSGNPRVTGNKRGSTDNNANLADGTFIHVTGALNSEARIGIHMSYPTSGNITSGLRNKGTAENFVSDDAAYEVRIDGVGEAYLYKEAKAEVDSWRALQNAVDNAGDGDIIRLSGDVIRTEQLSRIQVRPHGDVTRFTIDLAGNKLDRNLSTKYDDGQVIEVFSGAVLTIRDSVGGGIITHGYAKQGGGIYINEGATCIITGGTITGNKADDDGGGIYAKGTLKMTGGAVTNNYADDNGGGLYVTESGRIDLTGADISYNTADDEGGGIKICSNADSRITDCKVSYNKSDDEYGGGIMMDSSGKTMTITDTKIDHNTSGDDGGGIYLRYGNIVMSGGSLSENYTKNDGGGAKITKDTTFTANGVTISKNNADSEEGGGLKNYGTTTLTNCLISSNKAYKAGGGVFNDDDQSSAGVLNLFDCTVFGNVSHSNGGGVYSDYKLTVIGGSITGNTSFSRGGGIFVGDDSKDTNIGRDLVVKDNAANGQGKDIFLRTGRLVVKEKLTEGAEIGITKENDEGIGTFTKGYSTLNGTELPSGFFFSPEGFGVELKGGEAVLATSWKTLREDIQNAESGSEIILTQDYTASDADDYLEIKDKTITIDLNGHVLNRNLSEKDGDGHVFWVKDGATLNLKDGTAADNEAGKGKITGGYSKRGGGIYVGKGATLNATGIKITDNRASDDGGGVYVSENGKLTMTNCTVTHNTADDCGGGIFSDEGAGEITLDTVCVTDNTAYDDGGGIKLWFEEKATIKNSEVTGNYAKDCGGGIYVEAEKGKLIIRDTRIDNNRSKDDGAGIKLELGEIDMQGGSISGNKTGKDSGGIKVTNKTSFWAYNVNISNNVAEEEEGGGIKNYGTTYLTDCIISGNSAGKQGGGIYNDKDGSGSNGEVTINGCRIYGNSAADDGGGIWSDYKLTLGGTNRIGAHTVNEAEYPENRSENRGGGIYIGEDAEFTKIEGSLTATGNKARNGDDIYLRPGQKLTLTNLIDGTEVGELDMAETGDFTEGYGKYYPYGSSGNDPSGFFCTSDKAIRAEWNSNKTEARLHSDWPDLQALIDAASRKESRADAGHPETANGVVTLDKHYTAGSDDDRLKIKEGYDVTIDLNSWILDRNLNKKDGDGHVFEVFEDGTLTIRDSSAADGKLGGGLITGGYSKRGGGIYINEGGTLNMQGGSILGNIADKKGGGIFNKGALNMTGGALIGNNSDEQGGGIFSAYGSSLDLRNVYISENKAGDEGGGLCINNADKATITTCIITDNSAADYGGGLYVDAVSRTFYIKDTKIEGNYALDDGGGIHLTRGSINMERGTLSGNVTANDGGGIKIRSEYPYNQLGQALVESVFTATDVTIENNKAITEEGGGIKNFGRVVLTRCTISGNSAEMQGGGIFNDEYGYSSGTVELEDCIIQNNSSQSKGGGIYSDTKLSIIGGEITGNTSSDKGGGVFIDDDSANTGIEGAPVIKDNTSSTFADDMYLRNKEKLELTGELTSDADIYVDLEKGTGVLTSGYKAKNGTEDPETYFTIAKGYYTKFTKEGEVEICTDWPALKKKIESAESGSVIILDKDYAAADSDDRIKIENKNVTIDLNGYTLNRNRKDRTSDGHVLEVFSGAELTIIDRSEEQTGTITGAWSYEGGIFVNSNAALNLQGGTITGNRADKNGGGIYSDGTLTMTGGVVESNKASESGGGIYMTGSGTLNLEGGTVTKNEAGGKGGGIMISNGTAANVKGSPVVAANRAAEGGIDICLSDMRRISVTGAFDEGARLGVAKSNKGRITDGYSLHNGDADPANYFVSTEGYGVYLDNGEVVLDRRTYGATDYMDPFISWNNQIIDSDTVSSQNWMAGISGERYITEINNLRAHDSGMNNVDHKNDGEGQFAAQIAGALLTASGLFLTVVSVAAAPFTGGATLGFAAYFGLATLGTLGLDVLINLAVPSDWSSRIVAFLSDGRGADMAKTQIHYIDEQLRDGARILDIRLNNRKKEYRFIGDGVFNGYEFYDDGKNLWICHGKAGGGTYQANDPQDEYLSFSQVLEWVKSFLEEHPTETVILDLSPETEDESQHRTIEERAKKIVGSSLLQINPSTGEPYLYKEPGTDDYFAPGTHIPKLADARGKVVLRGYCWGFDGADAESLGFYQSTPEEMVESLIELDLDKGTFDLPTDADTHFSTDWHWGLNCTGQTAGQIKYALSAEPPTENAAYVNPRVIGDGKIFGSDKTGKYMGSVSMDAFDANYAEQIWRTNFFEGLQYRTVTVKSDLDGPSYPDQTYKLLKGTKIDIPGNIYKRLDEGLYFDCWESDDGSRYYPGDSFKVDEDVTFTARWLEEGQIPVQIVWKDGDDADDLRPESIRLKITTGTQSKDVELTGAKDWRATVNLTGKATGLVPDWERVVADDQHPNGSDAEGQYSYEYKFEEGTGYTVTLTHTPQIMISTSGTVIWDDDDNKAGKRPESVTIYLLKGNEEIGSQQVSADGTDSWKFDFGDMALYENGEEIDYSITEIMEGSAADLYNIDINGFKVTNTYTPPAEKKAAVIGSVEWDDDNNSKNIRPGEVHVTLKDGSGEVGTKSVALGSSGMWVWSFEDLPLNGADGKPINYGITPADVSGYKWTCEQIKPDEGTNQSGSGSIAAGDNIYLFRIRYTLDVPENEKTAAEIEEHPEAIAAVYNGQPQKLIKKGDASGGTMMYALSRSADTAPEMSGFSPNVPEAVNAGPYYVWYYVKGDALHTDVSIDKEHVAAVTIEKAEQKIEAEDVSCSDGDTGRRINAAVTGVKGSAEGVGDLSYKVKSGDDIVSVNTATGVMTILKAGTAIVTVTAEETDNYTAASIEVMVTVERVKHTLTFYEDTEGTQVRKTYTLYDGESLSGYADYGLVSPDEMEKDGYTLAGWVTKPGIVVNAYCDKSGVLTPALIGKVFDFNREIKEDMDAYPLWIRDRLNVIIDTGAPDGEVEIDDEQVLKFIVNIDEKIAMRYLISAQREGYELAGWYTQGGVLWNGEDWNALDYVDSGWKETAGWGVTPKYCDRDENGDIIREVNLARRFSYYTVTLTAHWTPETPERAGVEYIVGDDGTGEMSDDSTYALGDVIRLGIAPTAKEGKLFTGWEIDGDDNLYSAEGDYTFKDWSLVKDGMLTFKAKYIDKPEFAVYFDSNGGTEVEPVTINEDTEIEKEPLTVRDGYEFLGWFDEKQSAADRVGFPYRPTGERDVTLKAHWRIRKYKITFDSAGGTEVDPITADYRAKITRPDDPLKEHYIFDGWYPSLPDTMPLGGLNVTATWKPMVYSITFDSGNGKEPVIVEGIYGSAVEEPETPKKDGHVFAGWLDGNDLVTFPVYMPADNPTYKAKWKTAQDAPAINAEAVDAYSVKVTDSIDGAEYIIVPAGQEPRAKDWAAAKTGDGGDIIFDNLTPNTGYEVWARMPETDDKAQSDAAKVKVTTHKEDPSADAPKAVSGLTYTGKPQALVSGGAAEGGTIEYAISTDNDTPPENGWSTDVPSAVDAGSYHVWWRVSGDDLHKDIEPECVDVTIAKAVQKITGDEAVSGKVGESGKVIEASVTGVGGTSEGVGALSFEVTEGSDAVSVDAKTGTLIFKASGTATVKVKAAATGNYNGAEILVIVTVTENQETEISYFNTEGDGLVWTKGSNVTADFTFKRSADDSTTFGHFTGVSVDGEAVDALNYTAESGSVIVKLKPVYLETLSLGAHTLTAAFDDANAATADFRIVESGSPEDPDDGGGTVTPEDPDDGGDNVTPEKPDNGDGDNVTPEKPDNGDGDNVTPEKPDNGDGDNVTPEKPDNGDGDNVTPGKPDNGDGDNATPGDPDNGDGDNVTPGEPDNGDGDDVTPGDPDDGDDVTPGDPDDGDGDDVTPEDLDKGSTDNKKPVNTGDESDLALWLMLMSLSAAALFILAEGRRKRSRR